MRIGLDIDGVLYEWERTARYMLREVLPDSPYKADGPLGQPSTHWNYIKQHVAPEHFKWLWNEGVELGLFRYGHLHKGAVQAVRFLSTIADVSLITSRPRSAMDDTMTWLAHLRLPITGISTPGPKQPKSSVKPECDVYLDDKPENCEDLAANTKARGVFLLDRPWNHDWRPSYHCGIRRVYSWQEFHNWAWTLRVRPRVTVNDLVESNELTEVA